MADEVGSHTLRLLQEMRADMARMNARFDTVDAKFDALDERLTDLTQRIDGNTLTFNLVAGVVYDHEERLSGLEQERG